MVTEERIRSAAGQVLGSAPSVWNFGEIARRLDSLQPLSEQPVIRLDSSYAMPPVTYFYWLLRNKGAGSLAYTTSIVSAANISEFEADYRDLAEEAMLTARLDRSNFAAERSITPLDQLLHHSLLAITAVYRYIAAQENSLEFMLTDKLILKAIKEIRANPFLFFAYGQDEMSLMPVLWEDV